MQGRKKFTYHAVFFRMLLEIVFHQNKGWTKKRKARMLRNTTQQKREMKRLFGRMENRDVKAVTMPKPRDQPIYRGAEKCAIKNMTLNDNICNIDIILRGKLEIT